MHEKRVNASIPRTIEAVGLEAAGLEAAPRMEPFCENRAEPIKDVGANRCRRIP
jgi:hypothetical protein